MIKQPANNSGKCGEHLEDLRAMEEAELLKLERKNDDDQPIVSSDETADKLEDSDEESASGEVVSENLYKIRRAITWAEKCNGGKCFFCGKEIEEKRLQASPASITCTEHMSEEDSIRMEDILEK